MRSNIFGRKFIIAALAATALVPGIASAQSAREVRQDRQEVQRDRAEVRDDIRRGDYNEARRDRQETREDRRETRNDWQDYRRTHRDQFRGGAYRGPRGYAYRPIAPGHRFERQYYGQRYWVANPARYRLPHVAGYQRWVRYGNDVVLVDIRSGRVIQVYSRFFW